MDKATVNRIILFLKSALTKSGVNVDSIVLFGSALTDRMTQHSDVDILIVSDDFVGKDLFERSEITMAAEIETMKKFKVPMDIINLSPIEYAESASHRYYPSKIVA